MKLTNIDLSCSAFSNMDCDAIDEAIGHGNVEILVNLFHKTYGDLTEVLFINGPHQGRSILVFTSGIGILVGFNTPIGILTHGYVGQGPQYYTNFLKLFGFIDFDVSLVNIPSILSKDGKTIKGISDNIRITWDDGYILPLEFIEQYERLFKS